MNAIRRERIGDVIWSTCAKCGKRVLLQELDSEDEQCADCRELRRCVVCGKEFRPPVPRQEVCSEDCKFGRILERAADEKGGES